MEGVEEVGVRVNPKSLRLAGMRINRRREDLGGKMCQGETVDAWGLWEK